MKTVAVIPAFNEEKRIRSVIVQSKKYVDKVIVVDDGSNDRTADVSRKAGAEVIRYKTNMGKGYAMRIGLRRAISLKPRVIVSLDADGQHDPKYLPYFIKAVEDGADYVSGCRDLSKYPFNRKIGNFGLTVLTNMLCPTGIMDTECGFRAFSLRTAKKLNLRSDRYETEVEFAFNAWKNKLKVRQIGIEVPVFHSKAAVKRGIKNFFYLLKIRFK
jgi:glycosyltransferase involved in cell wall biosynthesis